MECLTVLRVTQGCLSSTPRKQINLAHRGVSRGLAELSLYLLLVYKSVGFTAVTALCQIRYFFFLFFFTSELDSTSCCNDNKEVVCRIMEQPHHALGAASHKTSHQRVKKVGKKWEKRTNTHKQQKMSHNKVRIYFCFSFSQEFLKLNFHIIFLLLKVFKQQTNLLLYYVHVFLLLYMGVTKSSNICLQRELQLHIYSASRHSLLYLH